MIIKILMLAAVPNSNAYKNISYKTQYFYKEDLFCKKMDLAIFDS